ncbi:MAG: D-(-)-3-hydroxybutyrate oligomer hydrolase [Pseudomonadota bacterium]|nr:D-(-)-3-hydroxybutyrate oligomer hydrolase [Pseudomonadota bacterium]
MSRHFLRFVSCCLSLPLGLALPALAAPADTVFTEARHQSYDGRANDLLTGGLGRSGLQNAAPAFADALHPTAAELRTRAIYNNYRALIDVSARGGYGVLFGPNIDLDGNDTLGEGRIAGDEYLAYADDGSGRKNVTVMAQIPAGFDRAHPCIVTAVSSGSRGVYGAIGTSGEWGLKRGCAVAYSDKGTGNGADDLQADTINLIDGTRADADAAGSASNFTAALTATQRADFVAANPGRFAFKQAHSQQNPEADWGRNTLDAVRFAFRMLNRQFGTLAMPHPFDRRNTLVIASSASNGAGAALLAAEQDEDGLIDGVAASEPQIQSRHVPGLRIQRGARPPFAGGGKALYDYFTVANLFQPCAALAPSVAASPVLAGINAARASARCAALHANALLSAGDTAGQAEEALAVLHATGWEPDSDLFHATHYATAAVPAVTLTYANAYGRFSVTDNLCGYSFGATSALTAAPAPLAAAAEVQLFASGNGVPPTGGVNIINNAAPGGPLLDALSRSASTGVADYNFDGALCLRKLFTDAQDMAAHGVDEGDDGDVVPPAAHRVARGIAAVRASGDLHGKPVILVQGRSDTLVPVNFASRYYLGLNAEVEGRRSGLRYYEVTNAQHFDAFIGLLPGYDTRLVPLHVYLVQALNLMYAHLRDGKELPPSQVVHTTPRGGVAGAAPQLTLANVPPIDAAPAARIEVEDRVVHVPE